MLALPGSLRGAYAFQIPNSKFQITLQGYQSAPYGAANGVGAIRGAELA